MSDKYETPDNEKEILPNKLGLNNKGLIEKEEAKGFAKAGILLGTSLTNETVIDVDFINNIHKIAFEDLKFKSIYTYAYDLRPFLYPTLEKNNFKPLWKVENKHQDVLFVKI